MIFILQKGQFVEVKLGQFDQEVIEMRKPEKATEFLLSVFGWACFVNVSQNYYYLLTKHLEENLRLLLIISKDCYFKS